MPQMGKVMKGQRGKSLVIVLIIIGVGSMAIASLLPFVTTSMTRAAREDSNARTYYAADAAVQRVITHAVLTSPDDTPDGKWLDSYLLFDGKPLSEGVTLDYEGESYKATVDVYTTEDSASYRIVSWVGGFEVIECHIKHWFGDSEPYQVDISSWEIK